MENKHGKRLPHLIDSIPSEAKRNRISMYTIALEGWRRGLNLNFYSYINNNKLDIKYSLNSPGRIHHFEGSGGDLNTEKAIEICDDKALTKTQLKSTAVPTPHGKSFENNKTISEIMDHAKTLYFPLVVKPTDGSGGKGVVSNIKDNKELKEALLYLRDTLGFQSLIVEEYVPGEEIRVFIVGDNVLAAVKRIPANVIGDGINPISKLIEMKNELRKSIPHLYFRPIKLDSTVKKTIHAAGYTLDSVPKQDERIFLRTTSNISTGGDPIDVTEKITNEQKKTAIKAVKSIPGLVHCGVDMVITNEDDTPVILELNTRPGLGSHLFPVEGEARDIPKAIIDLYFPNTKGISTERSNVFFDFQKIKESLIAGSTKAIEVFPAEKNKLIAKRYIINTSIDAIEFYQWLNKRVLNLNLNGFIEQVDEENIEIVIAGKTENDIRSFSDLIGSRRFKSQIFNITKEYWGSPIKLGFEIKNDYLFKSNKELENEIEDIKKKMKQTKKEDNLLNQRINMIQNSRMWKMTSPLRNLGGKIKKCGRIFE
ncbi:ATP-grasp domain-containing protein [Lentibacillus sp. CBA3610]|uniref:ATP-grasp domain-containing protein n=1 Tax=Lentibacillus sp. CBA3610 TaxID=2518176 RepID=UPI001595A093|nr:ATP-grasp domain-containing protein [Lentibacillus sp. CBA3610]QKY70430.1 ATP-grasp domain-containing protein [Lentibacillus sp. CBA3610]